MANLERLNGHLCTCCDVFFQNVGDVFYKGPSKPDSSCPSFVSQETELTRYPHHPTINDVLKSAKRGCHVCRLFAAQLDQREINILGENSNHLRAPFDGTIQLVYYYLAKNPSKLTLRLLYYTPRGWREPDEYSGRCFRKSPNFFVPLTLYPTRDGRTAQDPFEPAQNWIRDCLMNHASCQRPLLQGELWPSRLIYVGELEDFSDVYVCSTSKISPEPCYVTLSHTWGEDGLSEQSKHHNASGFEQRIIFDNLVKTFQDAIKTARRLRPFGVRYLWIDALCIIQGNDEDFSAEGGKMYDIYTNSFCTLAASTGVDGSCGFYPPTDPFIHHSCLVKTGSESCLGGQRFYLRCEDILGDKERGGTIRSRAWCFQELFLSKRILYFAPGRLAWECVENCATSEEPAINLRSKGSIGSAWSYRPLKPQEQLLLEPGRSTLEGLNPISVKVYQRWTSVLLDYTDMHLTKAQDRLIAVGGVAKQLWKALDGSSDYIVGLWSEYLHTHLLWRSQTPRKIGASFSYTGPTWSWCSVLPGVRVYNHRIAEHGMLSFSSLIQADVESHFVMGNPFGSLKLDMREDCAILRIRAPIFSAEIKPLRAKWGGPRSLCVLLLGGRMVDGAHINLDFGIPSDDVLDVCCIIITREDLRTDSGTEPQLVGLLLLPHEKTRARYLRIGLCFVLPLWLLDHARSTPLSKEHQVEESFPNGDHRITIV